MLSVDLQKSLTFRKHSVLEIFLKVTSHLPYPQGRSLPAEAAG